MMKPRRTPHTNVAGLRGQGPISFFFLFAFAFASGPGSDSTGAGRLMAAVLRRYNVRIARNKLEARVGAHFNGDGIEEGFSLVSEDG